MNLNFRQRCFFGFFFIVFCSQSLQASQYWPNSVLFKSMPESPYLAAPNITISGAYAKDAYNADGKSVPFLQQYGSEDLLKRFVDTTLPSDSVESMGNGLISGEYHFRQLITQCSKNIMHGFFIGLEFVFQDLTVSSINVDYAPSEEQLTAEQKDYLVDLKQIIPSTINESGLFTTFVLLGWHKKFESFKHLDFLDICFDTGFAAPSSMKRNNNSILQIPFIDLPCFVYPLISILTIGFREKYVLGWYGLVMPYQPTVIQAAVNTTSSNSQLLLTDSVPVILSPGLNLSSAIYLQISDLYPGYTGTIAYSCMGGASTSVKPIHPIEITDLSEHDPWNCGSLIFQLDYNFATKSKPRAPIVSGFFSVPLSGKLYQKSYLFGGACTLQINYDF